MSNSLHSKLHLLMIGKSVRQHEHLKRHNHNKKNMNRLFLFHQRINQSERNKGGSFPCQVCIGKGKFFGDPRVHQAPSSLIHGQHLISERHTTLCRANTFSAHESLSKYPNDDVSSPALSVTCYMASTSVPRL